MEQISVEEVKRRLDNNERMHLVDVREPAEVAEFNIGGHHIPLGRIQNMQVDEIENLKEEEVVVYCRSGNRSTQASLIMETLGFKNVKNLKGGMLDWKAKFGDKRPA